jgi:hypothetical protein
VVAEGCDPFRSPSVGKLAGRCSSLRRNLTSESVPGDAIECGSDKTEIVTSKDTNTNSHNHREEIATHCDRPSKR